MITYEEWEAIQEDLEDLEFGPRVQFLYEQWKKDPSTSRPWEEVEAALIADGLLDE